MKQELVQLLGTVKGTGMEDVWMCSLLILRKLQTCWNTSWIMGSLCHPSVFALMATQFAKIEDPICNIVRVVVHTFPRFAMNKCKFFASTGMQDALWHYLEHNSWSIKPSVTRDQLLVEDVIEELIMIHMIVIIIIVIKLWLIGAVVTWVWIAVSHLLFTINHYHFNFVGSNSIRNHRHSPCLKKSWSDNLSFVNLLEICRLCNEISVGIPSCTFFVVKCLRIRLEQWLLDNLFSFFFSTLQIFLSLPIFWFTDFQTRACNSWSSQWREQASVHEMGKPLLN